MTSLLLAAVLLRQDAPVYVLVPSDDLWVYPHATEPDKDPYLRVWGTDDGAVAEKGDAHDSYSYSYLKFDLKPMTTVSRNLVGAKLVLTHVADPAYTPELSQGSPLEVRSLNPGFAEKDWRYEDVNKLAPSRDPKTIFGRATLGAEPKKGVEVQFEIDLMKGPGDFAKAYFEAVAQDKPFALALTSSLDPSAGGSRAVYKFFSKDHPDEAKRPKLKLEVKPD